MLGLMKVYGVALFGLVMGAGVGARAATVTTGKTRHHSAGTARVSAKLTAHSASHTSAKSASARTSGTKTGVAKTSGTGHAAATGVVGHRRGRGARPTLAVRRTRYHEHFSASSFADNLTLGDVTEG